MLIADVQRAESGAQQKLDLSIHESHITCVKCGELLEVPLYESDPEGCMAVLERHIATHESAYPRAARSLRPAAR